METQKQISISISIEASEHIAFVVEKGFKINGNKIEPINHRVPYNNSKTDRQRLQESDVPDNFKSAIFDAWGETPTVADPEIPKPIEKPEAETTDTETNE